jgi:hypothetical protein
MDRHNIDPVRGVLFAKVLIRIRRQMDFERIDDKWISPSSMLEDVEAVKAPA